LLVVFLGRERSLQAGGFGEKKKYGSNSEQLNEK
jgi:hypothetical protein